MNKIILIVAAALGLLLTGCAGVPPMLGGSPSASALSYTPGQAQQVQAVQLGTVVSVQPITISAPGGATTPGGLLGALAGGFIGSRIGNGNGSKVAAVLGAIAGGIGGEAATNAAYKQRGVQITVAMDGGGNFAVTQAADVQLYVGERVEVVGGYGQPARVLPLQATQGSKP
ncbi:putative lipoprotein pcp [Thiomonas sp. X19]|uniref:glycine zipper 2TM domain-containing protein n=1 Tax=Thiomonas sp. X19 TaxID=1050370 RepID=UPI000B6ED2BB|nr:glycine zipper 2TM domain-containing protein [Thiomonas sp. X19]SCC95248.1 putative lipoprotein pcp [Thiomonas sp. X19]